MSRSNNLILLICFYSLSPNKHLYFSVLSKQTTQRVYILVKECGPYPHVTSYHSSKHFAAQGALYCHTNAGLHSRILHRYKLCRQEHRHMFSFEYPTYKDLKDNGWKCRNNKNRFLKRHTSDLLQL